MHREQPAAGMIMRAINIDFLFFKTNRFGKKNEMIGLKY